MHRGGREDLSAPLYPQYPARGEASSNPVPAKADLSTSGSRPPSPRCEASSSPIPGHDRRAASAERRHAVVTRGVFFDGA